MATILTHLPIDCHKHQFLIEKKKAADGAGVLSDLLFLIRMSAFIFAGAK